MARNVGKRSIKPKKVAQSKDLDMSSLFTMGDEAMGEKKVAPKKPVNIFNLGDDQLFGNQFSPVG